MTMVPAISINNPITAIPHSDTVGICPFGPARRAGIGILKNVSHTIVLSWTRE